MQEHKDQRRAVFQFYDTRHDELKSIVKMDELYALFKAWCGDNPDERIKQHHVVNRYQFRTWWRKFADPRVCRGDYQKWKNKYQ